MRFARLQSAHHSCSNRYFYTEEEAHAAKLEFDDTVKAQKPANEDKESMVKTKKVKASKAEA